MIDDALIATKSRECMEGVIATLELFSRSGLDAFAQLTEQELTAIADMLDHIAAAHFAHDIYRAEYLACETAARFLRAALEGKV